ncbi:BlaI/MecI/CopY family transcriptional regulator [Pseudoalteromonas sp. SSM20]|uniref:BlaI/MecI/CopY family transcriptional regulator n=1 Tax=unclassified Pseudoalteromonas TaxID=194690 RepID=UPI00237E154B|nr:BlaI/MecI/CopY family transcriptional regulator [Pseudoalteromonas sp. G4]MDE3271847.1 BlaI/MecI/CopY family transcriptional regulator [Pseudoalteromonas sp. G4]
MKLSDFELDVMQLMWQHEPCTATEIHQLLSQDKDVAYTTIKTIIDRLEKKGAVERADKQGRAIVYRSKVQQSTLSSQETPSFMQRFFSGNSRSLIAHFIKEEELNEDDINYLQDLLNKKKSNK